MKYRVQDQEEDQRGPVKEDCQACKLNTEDAMDHSKLVFCSGVTVVYRPRKGKGKWSIAVHNMPQSYGNSHATWYHTVLSATKR